MSKLRKRAKRDRKRAKRKIRKATLFQRALRICRRLGHTESFQLDGWVRSDQEHQAEFLSRHFRFTDGEQTERVCNGHHIDANR